MISKRLHPASFSNVNTQLAQITPQINRLRNIIINGGFDVWQRGVSSASSGYYTADRWSNTHTESTKTHSKQAFTAGQTDVPNFPGNFSRTDLTSASTNTSNCIQAQKIEDVVRWAGKTVTLSFWAKANASKNMSIEFEQNFGTGGSAVVTAISVQKIALTTSWQRFTKTVALPSSSGKTIGVGSFTRMLFWFDAGSNFNARTDSLGNQSGIFDIANVCLVEGSTAMEWQNEPYADVLQKCLRYYYKTGGDAVYQTMGSGSAGSATDAIIRFTLPVEMRVAPTAIDYANIALGDDVNASIAVTSAVLSANSSRHIGLATVSVASGLTQYRMYYVKAYNSLAGMFAFSAEL